mmetsp:Transcript_5647/g.18055  ORF Transcript_5647/g.18055 Transcript_5647/m.18055 type:complete len:412 (-) Transcript_5647:2201-3436(-)
MRVRVVRALQILIDNDLELSEVSCIADVVHVRDAADRLEDAGPDGVHGHGRAEPAVEAASQEVLPPSPALLALPDLCALCIGHQRQGDLRVDDSEAKLDVVAPGPAYPPVLPVAKLVRTSHGDGHLRRLGPRRVNGLLEVPVADELEVLHAAEADPQLALPRAVVVGHLDHVLGRPTRPRADHGVGVLVDRHPPGRLIGRPVPYQQLPVTAPLEPYSKRRPRGDLLVAPVDHPMPALPLAVRPVDPGDLGGVVHRGVQLLPSVPVQAEAEELVARLTKDDEGVVPPVHLELHLLHDLPARPRAAYAHLHAGAEGLVGVVEQGPVPVSVAARVDVRGDLVGGKLVPQGVRLVLDAHVRPHRLAREVVYGSHGDGARHMDLVKPGRVKLASRARTHAALGPEIRPRVGPAKAK